MPDLAPPRQYVVRRPSGDPDAARRLATAYDALADDVLAQVRLATGILDALGDDWLGRAASARHIPTDVLAIDSARVARALRHSADDLRHYAHRLAKAHEHHGWSLGKLVALGAMVTVGVAAVVVTVGAAAPAEAAAAAAAVEAAEAAAATAGAASAGVAGDLTAWQALLGGLRPLSPFVVPHLVSSASSVGIDAASQLLATHRLDVHSLEVSGVIGFAGSSTGGWIQGKLATAPSVVSRAAEGAAWAGNGTVAAYADEGSVDPVDTLAAGLTGLVARDVRHGVDEARLLWRLRVPELPLGLESKREWRDFVQRLYAAVDAAGFRDATIVWRGSSITGFNFRNGHPFDSLYRSDWDLALVDDRAYAGGRALGMRGPWDEDRTYKLEKPRDVRNVGLLDVTRELSAEAERKVSWMVYKDLAAVELRPGKFLIVPRP